MSTNGNNIQSSIIIIFHDKNGGTLNIFVRDNCQISVILDQIKQQRRLVFIRLSRNDSNKFR